MNDLKYILRVATLLCVASLYSVGLFAGEVLDVAVETAVQAGGGSYAPFWLSSNKHGLASMQNNSAYIRGSVVKPHETNKRFSYAYGIDLVGAANFNSQFIIQQLYVDLRYRSLFLSAGSMERSNPMKNPLLSTGGFTWSGNARPIPQIRAGIYDYVSPFKESRWFALKGNLSYGWFTDGNYQEEQVNRQYGFMSQQMAYHHKEVYFRFFEPTQRFTLEACFEIDSQFGGLRTQYKNGEVEKREGGAPLFVDYLSAFIPMDRQGNYLEGNFVGSWQLKGDYQLTPTKRLSLNVETIFDDFSGMGRLNRLDGIYTLEYKNEEQCLISGAVIEYFQSTDQAGPIHFFPQYQPEGSMIDYTAKGADNYYNNYWHIGWSHWGQAIGNPLITSPVYNNDGWLGFKNNRVKALHVGVNGWLTHALSHRLLATYMKGWGTPFVPFTETKSAVSLLAEFCFMPKAMKHSTFKLAAACDFGTLLSDNWGVNLSYKHRF